MPPRGAPCRDRDRGSRASNHFIDPGSTFRRSAARHRQLARAAVLQLAAHVLFQARRRAALVAAELGSAHRCARCSDARGAAQPVADLIRVWRERAISRGFVAHVSLLLRVLSTMTSAIANALDLVGRRRYASTSRPPPDQPAWRAVSRFGLRRVATFTPWASVATDARSEREARLSNCALRAKPTPRGELARKPLVTPVHVATRAAGYEWHGMRELRGLELTCSPSRLRSSGIAAEMVAERDLHGDARPQFTSHLGTATDIWRFATWLSLGMRNGILAPRHALRPDAVGAALRSYDNARGRRWRRPGRHDGRMSSRPLHGRTGSRRARARSIPDARVYLSAVASSCEPLRAARSPRCSLVLRTLQWHFSLGRHHRFHVTHHGA